MNKENMSFLHGGAIGDSVKAAPPVTVSGMEFGGMDVPEIIQILTAVYVVVMILDKCFQLYLRYKNRKNESEE